MSALLDVKGLGKVTLNKLNEMGISSIDDLLMCFPKRYKIQKIDKIHNAKINQTITIYAKVQSKPSVYFFRKNLSKLSFKAVSDNQKFRVDVFNRHFLSKVLYTHSEIIITGQFKSSFKVFTASEIALMKNYDEGIIPQYDLADIHDGRIKKIINEVLGHGHQLYEPLPKSVLNKRQMTNINQVIHDIHQPDNEVQLNRAMTRLKYQELFEFALRIELIKQIQKSKQSSKKPYQINIVKALIKQIGFELTESQKKASNEIFIDLKSKHQMNRLLQGDVGSGKTIVAILASLASVTAGYQVAVMAPTLVLSHQHYQVFKKYLEPFDIKIALLTSETHAKKKTQIMHAIHQHNLDIIIGTHALIQETIDFAKLGLAIIDEQHRFGVRQRKTLREKGYFPDILLMSATPIPRSLAISIFESSDISQITEKPLGRKPIITNIYPYSKMKSVYRRIEMELSMHHQIYVICPLIDSSESSPYFSVYETLQLMSDHFNDKQVDILHGKLTDQNKINVLKRFKQGDIQILISTTVIEVGIHIDNATTMVIMNANTFGLAQLHQLRGRIGRKDIQSYCCLVVDDGVEDLERLNILENTDDGFEISAYDLRMRGPGEVFGKNQSGIPQFNFANLIEDRELFAWAQEDARMIIDSQDIKSLTLKENIIKTLDSYHLD
ncbi:MAG TPA: ATP-dependent DNA helicase RecG [Candidatus Izemoplasmatales bacterium]|nr:ATP-dependent DNA helicase RecG [Candidatus Izemoplasmatales bacterium]